MFERCSYIAFINHIQCLFHVQNKFMLKAILKKFSNNQQDILDENFFKLVIYLENEIF
jgi:hypothetical protein